MLKFSVFAICALCVVCLEGASVRDIGRQTNPTLPSLASPSNVPTDVNATSILDCITCMNKQPRLKEWLHRQKTAQRLDYIKFQLNNTLHVKDPPADPPKLETLPNFLVDQLINSPTDHEEESVREGESKQMVLFPEQETSNCRPSIKNSVCLTFKLGEALTMSYINEVIVWLNSEKLGASAGTKNFMVVYGSAFNNSAESTAVDIQESDGWYGVDVKEYLSLRLNEHNASDSHTFVIRCDGCELLAAPDPANATNSLVNSFMFLRTTTIVRSRSKRGASCVYTPGDECCRDNFDVEFATLGDHYKMIIYPSKFNAYMCRGNCYFYSSLDSDKHYTTLLATLMFNNKTSANGIKLPTTCCTPTKFSGLSVIYATSGTTFHKAIIPNMVVDSCGCN